jgi:HD-GYP domain-containing protein (c-di-GMP phosphodiesterase class II)
MAANIQKHLLPVACSRLAVGMYVAELDRPRLHTPFHLHGFMVTRPAQIGELARYCDYVYVDPMRSESMAPDAVADEPVSAPPGPPAASAVSAASRARTHLQALAIQFSSTLRDFRHGETLPVARLRDAASLVVNDICEDADIVPWLLAAEMRLAHVCRRALDSATLMALLGHRLGFDRQLLDDLAVGGLLLDIGKAAIPVTLLAKPDALTGDELAYVRRHVRLGVAAVHNAEAPGNVIEDVIHGHHERLDGSGYPRALRGTNISLPSRAAGIVDTYGALTLDRRYARGVSPHDALGVINHMRGRHFDVAMVRALVRQLGVYPTGCWVRLADDRIGVVCAQTPGEPLQPRVLLVGDRSGMPLPEPAPLWRPARRGELAGTLVASDVPIHPKIVAQALRIAPDLRP